MVFLSLEDVQQELERRLHVFARSLDAADRDAVHGNVLVIPASGRGLALAKPSSGGLPKAEEWFKRFAGTVRASAPRLLVIDTLNRFLGGLSENDGGHMAFVLTHLERLAAEANCAIVLCHHASKAALAAGTSNEAHAARGSSVITDNARWQCNLSIPRSAGPFKDKRDDERKRFVWLEYAKLNYGPPREPRLLVRGDGGSIRGATRAEHPAPPPAARRAGNPAPTARNNVFRLPQVADA